MDVEFQDLKWAIAAAQHRSLRQAAHTLGVRQSTLSRRLADLEHRLGAVLFERTTGGTQARQPIGPFRRIGEAIVAKARRGAAQPGAEAPERSG